MAYKADHDPYKGLRSLTPLPYLSHLIFCHSSLTLQPHEPQHLSLCLEHPPSKKGWLPHFIQIPTQFLQKLSLIMLAESLCPYHTHSNPALSFFTLLFIDISLHHLNISSIRTRTSICSMMYPHYLEQSKKENKCSINVCHKN